jgi:hypothetical protein
MLEVCNEKGACSQSSTQNVQTYGPLVPGDIHSVTPNVDGTKISWTVEADSNGHKATLTVTSDQGRSETFTVPVGVATFTTQQLDLGYHQTETVTVTLSDPSTGRDPVTQNGSATTADAPPPVVGVAIGDACNDSPGSTAQPCNHTGNALDDCTDASCAFIVLSLANWQNPPDCHFEATFDVVQGGSALRSVPNGTQQTDAYYGWSGQQVRAVCASSDGQVASPWIVWQ